MIISVCYISIVNKVNANALVRCEKLYFSYEKNVLGHIRCVRCTGISLLKNEHADKKRNGLCISIL